MDDPVRLCGFIYADFPPASGFEKLPRQVSYIKHSCESQ
jgi:hypothetical protein